VTGENTPGRDPVASYLLSLPDAEVTELLADCLSRVFASQAHGSHYRNRRPAARPDPIDIILSGTGT
jgi:hypothetical protein